MGKKFNSIFVALVFVALTAFLAAGSAEAFEVYNKTDITIHVAQIRGGTGNPLTNFQKDIPPGEKEQCNWQTFDCNTEGKRDSVVRFYVSERPSGRTLCESFPIKAGGWLTVRGEKGNYTCEAHSDF